LKREITHPQYLFLLVNKNLYHALVEAISRSAGGFSQASLIA
jgi:hypothetical protein